MIGETRRRNRHRVGGEAGIRSHGMRRSLGGRSRARDTCQELSGEEPNPVPTGVAVFPNDFRSIRLFAERANNIVQWTEFDRGGHFAAMEVPGLLIGEVRGFFRRFR
jgi:hypothetical protein